MKETCWKCLVRMALLIPAGIRQLVCRLLFCAGADSASPRSGLAELLREHNALRNQIDRCALRYGDGVHPKHRLTGYHDFFVRRLSPGERVLDVGCGYGAVAASMARAGAVVTGIDLDPAQISAAREKFPHENLTFVVGDATQDLPESTFDTIVLSSLLEHVADRVAFLQQVQARLHPQRWLIRVPMINRDWLVALKRELGLPFLSDPTHHTEYTKDSFEEEMRQAGLQVTSLECCWGEIWAEVRVA